MARDVTDLKTFTMRIPRDMWVFVKSSAAEQDKSMTDVIVSSLETYRKKIERKNRAAESK